MASIRTWLWGREQWGDEIFKYVCRIDALSEADPRYSVNMQEVLNVAFRRKVGAPLITFLNTARKDGEGPLSKLYADKLERARLVLQEMSPVEYASMLRDGMTQRGFSFMNFITDGHAGRVSKVGDEDVVASGNSVFLDEMLEIGPTADVYKTIARCLGAMRFVASKSANIEVDQYIVFAALIDLGVDPIRDREDLNLVEDLAEEGAEAARVWSSARGHSDAVKLVRAAAKELVISAAFKRKDT